jgi:predicted phage gp36 major capsid-like protein
LDKFLGLLPFFVLGALGVANLVASSGAMRGALRAEELDEERFALLRDQQDRLEFLREERRMQLEDLARENVKNGWRRKRGSNS